MAGLKATLACPCADRFQVPAFSYAAPPAGEAAFALSGEYRRHYRRCTLCRHWFGHHEMDLAALYSGAYLDATYGDGMRESFARIMALPPERSDNMGRVAAVCAFAERRFAGGHAPPRLLDVGSGLGVFAARMKEAGWNCTALDPDARAAAHAREVIGIAAIAGTFASVAIEHLGPFDLVSFNKVLEHVEDPVAMLAASRRLLSQRGFVYLEVPDAEAASACGPGREEFFIEHHHVFSAASTDLLAARAGFATIALERLREPSGKFTLRAFLEPLPAP
ncbi:MAG: class I SAM-dependent methyltransferase [Alphaproteobacteria bacterium]|nr:class I SAM-dependent methyltransferase [Alphaproteobacteria bacterium]